MAHSDIEGWYIPDKKEPLNEYGIWLVTASEKSLGWVIVSGLGSQTHMTEDVFHRTMGRFLRKIEFNVEFTVTLEGG